MRTTIFTFFAACCFILSSCSRYQINVISRADGVPLQPTGNFEFENDSVKIAYSFYGNNAPITISIQNKLNIPLYVDWQRSALIVDGKAISYFHETVNIEGNVNLQTNKYPGIGLLNNGSSYSSGNISAAATLPKSVTFLPPHSFNSSTPLYLSQGFLKVSEQLYYKKRQPYNSADSLNFVNVKAANFTNQTSPLTFKSYLTLYSQNGSEIKPIAFEHSFFVSQIINTTTAPENFGEFNSNRGDVFINSKATAYTKTMGSIGAVAGIGAAGALTNSNNTSK